MSDLVVALDQGTTSSRCIIFDEKGKQIAISQKEFDNYYPREDMVEQDPMDILNSQVDVFCDAVSKVSLEDIVAIGITNQRETTIVWDKNTNEVYRAIVWQDRRTAKFCDSIADKKDWIHKKTGLLIDPYFSATKLAWILDNVEGARKKAENGELLFGTVDTWLVYNLTKGEVHSTDYSNASRTMLFNINTLQWDEELLEFFNIPISMMPKVNPSSAVIGYCDESFVGKRIPIAGVAGDQQASLFGQMCFSKGEIKNTYGTGGFLLMNTGEKPVFSKNGLLTTIAWGIDGKINYAMEGSIFVSGAAISWLRDKLGVIASASETEKISRSVENSLGVYVVPAFSGLGAPYWNPNAKAAIVGLTQGASKEHIIRATVEAMAYQTVSVVRLMESESGISVSAIKVDGGAVVNDFLLEFQSDVLNLDIIRPQTTESTAVGAAYLAMLAVGVYSSMDDLRDNWQIDKIFKSSMDEKKRSKLIDGWEMAVDMVNIKHI